MEQAATAPQLPPNLNETSAAPSAAPTAPSSTRPSTRYAWSRRGIQEVLLARARIGDAELDGMTRETLVSQYKRHQNKTKTMNNHLNAVTRERLVANP